MKTTTQIVDEDYEREWLKDSIYVEEYNRELEEAIWREEFEREQTKKEIIIKGKIPVCNRKSELTSVPENSGK